MKLSCNPRFNFTGILLACVLSFSLFACTDLDPVNDRLDNVEEEIEQLKTEFAQIQEAWASYKVISDFQNVLPREDANENGGWLLNFTDGTSLMVSHGNDGLTPYVRIDNEGFWVVSYDGEEFDYLLNEGGEKLNAFGIDGNDGADGICVRVTIDDDGYYCFETYDPSNPLLVIDSITTPYSSDPSSTLAAIVKDEKTGTITLTMADGSSFVFEMQKTVPSGIVILATDAVKFKSPGDKVSFNIRINPSNIIFNYNVASEDCDLRLEFIEDGAFYDAEGTLPFKIDEISPSKDKSDAVIAGQYSVTMSDNGKNLVPYSVGVYLTLRYIDPNQEEVYLTSNPFVVEFDNSQGLLLDTGLPVLFISTPSEITSKDKWTEGCRIRVIKDGKFISFFDNTQIKGRGNSTWKYPKKPYAIKLDSKEEMLGMKKHKRWVLLANFIDRTLLRNDVAFMISKQTGLEYTPSGEFVEVFMNGKHQGNYYLTEQVKVDKNRVNVTELDPNVTSGEALTGGYLMEVDKYFDEEYKFRSKYFDMPWMFKDPDVVNQAQFDYMVNYVNQMEAELEKIPGASNYEDYLDIDSAVDLWLVNELMLNNEVNLPQSVYFYKDVNTKFKLGPVWDFDWGTLRSTAPTGFRITEGLYFGKLLKDAKFIKRLKERWSEFYGKFLTIPDYIDRQAAYIAKSQQINYQMWGCPEEPNKESADFKEAVEKIKKSYTAKLEFMNKQIPLL